MFSECCILLSDVQSQPGDAGRDRTGSEPSR